MIRAFTRARSIIHGRRLLNLQLRFFSTSKKSHSGSKDENNDNFKNISDEEWSKRLSPEVFQVCRKAGTEPPFSGEYYSHYGLGTYTCICCGSELFSSSSKFNSGSGWPSFHSAISNAVKESRDESYGMIRNEVLCAKCDAHLGHVFDDGPQPTGLRYCINSCCMGFKNKARETS